MRSCHNKFLDLPVAEQTSGFEGGNGKSGAWYRGKEGEVKGIGKGVVVGLG